MSSSAQARMDEMLPGLLQAVRSRRRRRRAFTAAAAALLVSAVTAVAWPDRGRVPQKHTPTPAIACEIVRDVPGIVDRCRVAPHVDPQWFVQSNDEAVVRAERFVDDATLQAFLRQDERPSGIVRVQGKVRVASAALDPFPAVDAE